MTTLVNYNRRSANNNQLTNVLSSAKNSLTKAFIDTSEAIGGKAGEQAAKSYLRRKREVDENQPSKRHKTMAKMRATRSGRKRPMMRSRSRKPLRRRPYKKRLGSMKRMIKKIARDASEPHRHIFGPDQTNVDGFTIQKSTLSTYRVDNVPKFGLDIIAERDDLANTYKGKEFYLKGFRIRGYIQNPSQYPCTVRIMIFRTKVQLEGATMNDVIAGQVPRFYNPVTGEANKLAELPRLFKYNPKLGPHEPYKIIKNKVWVLDGTRKNPGTINDEIDMSSNDGPDDLQHFDIYVPINKIQRQQLPQFGGGIYDQQINHFVSFYFSNLNVEDEPSQFPTCFFTGITYFKDD